MKPFVYFVLVIIALTYLADVQILTIRVKFRQILLRKKTQS